MPSKYWPNYADLSSDSSAESSQNLQESSSGDIEEVERREENEDLKPDRKGDSEWQEDAKQEDTGIVDRNENIGIVSRAMATNFQLPALLPREHASLFYLSLIEGRCRTQAAAKVNEGRALEDCVTEEHPEVAHLAQHFFTEMSKELLKAGMIPEEFVGRPLRELHLYLNSFDTMLSGIALARPQDLPKSEAYRAIDSNYNLPRGSVATLASSEDSLDGGVLSGGRALRKSGAGTTFPALDQQTSSLSGDTPAPPRTSTNTTARYSSSQKPTFITPFQTSRAPFQPSVPLSPFDQPSYESASASNYIALDQSDSFSQEGQQGSSQALVLRNHSFNMSQSTQSPAAGGNTARLLALMSPFTTINQTVLPDSLFETYYTNKTVIGKGGFGSVYKARYALDQAEYAIKKIVVPAHDLTQLVSSGKWSKVLGEVHAMAQLENDHIVRYNHSWMETRPAQPDGYDSEFDEESEVERSDDIASGKRSISFDNEAELDRSLQKRRRNSTTHEMGRSLILFVEEGASLPNAPTPPGTPQVKKARIGGHQNSSEYDSDDDSECAINFDALIYIKMKPYPLSLKDYIENGHCFHLLPTILILRKLLAGITYLHRKEIIHRDLKPANIFLSYPERDCDDVTPPDRFIDISACCPSTTRKIKYICPCIGDFGLVASLKAASSGSSSSQAPTSLALSHAGTTLYTPKRQEEICPKLDVYSLGVIAIELSCPFPTVSERAKVLEEVREGDFGPWEKGGGAPLGEAIRGMCAARKQNRWSTERVGEWLVKMEDELRAEMET